MNLRQVLSPSIQGILRNPCIPGQFRNGGIVGCQHLGDKTCLNEVELGEYCRRKGLFPQQIDAWRELCKQAHDPLSPKADRLKLRNQAKEIRRLDAELRRKEKALAEAAALLILQKKVRTLWEEPEVERSNLRSVG